MTSKHCSKSGDEIDTSAVQKESDELSQIHAHSPNSQSFLQQMLSAFNVKPARNPEDSPPECWEWERNSHQLSSFERYSSILPNLRRHLDTPTLRSPDAVSWMQEYAKRGHVPLAVHTIRNICKVPIGRVADLEDLNRCFVMFLIVLMRTLQDISTMRTLGYPVDEEVFIVLRDKCSGWIKHGFYKQHWPSLKETVEILEGMDLVQNQETIENFPSPYWILYCKRGVTSVLGGSHITFETPPTTSITSWKTGHTFELTENAKTGTQHRCKVTQDVLRVWNGIRSWDAVFRLGAREYIQMNDVVGTETEATT